MRCAVRRGRWTARWGAAAVVLGSTCLGAVAEGARPLDEPLPATNRAILQQTLEAAARELVRGAPLEPGTRLAITVAAQRVVDQEAVTALLGALVERGIEAWTVTGAAASETTRAAAGDTAALPSGLDLASLERGRGLKQGLRPSGDEMASEIGAATPTSGPPAGVQVEQLPLLELTVDEARVDYTRLHRAGVFGEQHVERRALGQLSGRLLRPQTRAIFWVGTADSSYADVVPRSELKALEDAARPELKGAVPVQGWTKAAEPILVGVLVVGLVALFYTNRP